MTPDAYIASWDIEHINRIFSDVRYWYLNVESQVMARNGIRLMPPYLLIAYAENMLEYTAENICTPDKAKSMRKIREVLRMITEIVMSEGYSNMEVRMQILNLCNKYGYTLGGQMTMRL